MARRAATKQIEIPVTRYAVRGNTATLSHGQEVYRVENGKVELPAGETWYQPLIEAGILAPVPESD